MSACEASMSLLFYFYRGKQYLDVFCCSAKCDFFFLLKKKSPDQWSLVPNSEGASCLARQCISCEII